MFRKKDLKDKRIKAEELKRKQKEAEERKLLDEVCNVQKFKKSFRCSQDLDFWMKAVIHGAH